jgi:signal peptidase II
MTAPGRRLEWILVLLIVTSDQVTKALVRRSLDLHESVPVIPDLLALTRVHNTGAAFGMFNAAEFPGKTLVLTLVATLALVGVACILGGAIGNLIDRATAGYVLDFVDASWQGWHFWAFNVADAAITIGVVLMILDLLGLGRRASNPA